MPMSQISYVPSMPFNAIRENKILVKFPNLQYDLYDTQGELRGWRNGIYVL